MQICEIRGRKDFPTEPTERTETSGREEPSTDGTDVHRCRRVWHPCHTHAAKFCVFCEFCGRTVRPKYLCKSVKSVGGKIFPQNARNSQNLLQRKDSHGWHGCSQIRRVWHPCHTHAALRIPSTEPIPSLFAQVLPRNSRNSQKFLVEDILPRISQNTQKLLAEKSLPRISQMYTDFSSPPVVSVCSACSVGEL